MSELVYEQPDKVPVFRWDYGDTLVSWHDFVYPRRRGVVFFWGFFFWVWLLVAVVKAVVYFAGGLLMLVAWLFWAEWDLITYRHRLRVAEEQHRLQVEEESVDWD